MKTYPDFSGVTRVRLLRLLVFLRRHRFFHTAHALEKSTTVFFDLQYVARLVMKDQWEEAARYVSAFTPVQNASKEVSDLHEGMFMSFVVYNIAFGGEQGDRFASMFAPDKSDARNFAHKQRNRSSSDWQQIRHKTVAVLNSMAPITPELKDKLQFPCHMTRLSDMVPIGLPEFRRRRFYQKSHVSKAGASLLRKRLRSIQERTKSGLTSNSSSVCNTLNTEMEQASLVSAFSSDDSMRQAEASVFNQGNHAMQTCNAELFSGDVSALPQSKESSALIQLHHTPVLRHTGYHSSVMRICLIRILRYLKQSGIHDTARALETDTGLFFNKWHMEDMVAQFQWDEAAKYMSIFIPDRECSKEASNLLDIMQHLKENAEDTKLFEESRASCWKELRSKTIATLNELVPRTPELKGKLQFPCYKTKLEDTVPLGLRARQRHHKKRGGNMPAHILARFILQNRARSSKRKNDSEFPRNVASRTVDLHKPDSAVSAPTGRQGVPALHPIFPTSSSGEMSTSATNAGDAVIPNEWTAMING